MSKRRVGITLLCEDSQQESFIRKFLKKEGWNTREMRVEKRPSGKGSGDGWVIENFPNELKAYRNRKNRASTGLIAAIDADKNTLEERLDQLNRACNAKGIPFRAHDENVALIIPKRNIETWIHFLDGEEVDEVTEYKKLKMGRECKSAVNNLATHCQTSKALEEAPASLTFACDEYRKRIKLLNH